MKGVGIFLVVVCLAVLIYEFEASCSFMSKDPPAKTGSSLGDNPAIPSTSTESQYAVESIQEETTTAELDDNASEAKEQNEETMNMTPAPTIPLTQENARLGFSGSKAPTGKVLMHDISEGVTAFREKRPLHDDQIAFLIENRKPDVSFKFPGKTYCDKRRASGTMTRHCQRQWLDDTNFISYSVIDDGLYCLACSMFPMPAHQGSRSNVFITTPYRNWKDAVSDLKKHSALQYHRDSDNKMQGFLRTRSAPHTRVDQILSSKSRQVIEHNRKFLESIIRCLEHCGRQGIGLRGHRDDGNPLEEDDDQRGNMGNFKAVVTLVSRTDIDLREHLEKGRKNASYISKTTQNDLLQCVLEYIQQQIVDEVKKQSSGPFFGVIADEVTDCSNWEQLGIVLRYCKGNTPVERLLEYVKCNEITGKAIADEIIAAISGVGLDMKKCRCQTYDGAGNMAGKQKGAANQITVKTENERAPYFHCASHQLNLALSKASKVQEIHNMVCLMQTIGLFFKFSPKRQRTLESSIEDFCRRIGKNPNTVKSKLKPLCETRWVERHTAFDDLADLYVPLLECLDVIQTNEKNKWDPKTITEATGINAQLRSAKFIVPFVVCHYIFGYSKGLARQLQGTAIDIIAAFDKVDLVISELQDIRKDDVTEFSKLFETCSKMAESAATPLVKPRATGRQTLRNNVPAESVEEYFRRSVFIPFVDNVVSQLEDRFKGKSHDAIQALYLLPSNLQHLDHHTEMKLLEYYHDDLPSPNTFQQELRLWRRYCSNRDELPKTLKETLDMLGDEGCEMLYENIATILRIVLTYSATSASVERTNSALRFVKSSYRSTMGEERFNALVLLFVHKDIHLEYDKIIDRYARKYPRRMVFANPLTEGFD